MDQQTACTPPLFLACELGENTGKLGFTTGAAPRPRERQVAAGDAPLVLEEIRRAKHRCGWPEHTQGIRGDEAGRDGLWLHRFFVRHGREHSVVDSASMEGNRRYRRAKTDRLDVHKLLTMLLRYAAVERKVWIVVRVPSVEEEDRRDVHRELLTAKRDRTRVSHRMQGWLAGYGVRRALHGDVEAQREQVPQEDGSLLPPALRARLKRAWQQGCFLTAQITEREGERRAALRTRQEPVMEQVRQWSTWRGIGVKSAWRFVMACFAWRDLQTPKQVGACAGLTPTPSHSGASRRALGMTKAGKG